MRIEEFGHVEDHSLAGGGRDIEDLDIHPNRILGAGLHTEAAVNAFPQVDHKTFGPLLDIRIGMLLGLDVNTAGWTDGFAHHAGHAAGRTVFAFGQPVPCPGPGRQRPFFLRPLEGHGRGEVSGQSETMEGVEGEVTKKMPARDTKSRENLGKVEFLPKGELGALDNPRLNGHEK